MKSDHPNAADTTYLIPNYLTIIFNIINTIVLIFYLFFKILIIIN
jgi:hypothetical protein